MKFPLHTTSLEGLLKACGELQPRTPSAEVLEVLRDVSPAALSAAENLRALSSGEGICVFTGQQLGLFLGPAFTVYKIASAIALSATLQAKLGRPVVPIFWLQSEDHDFDEVRAVNLPTPDGGIARLELPRGEEKLSVGSRVISQEVETLLSELSSSSAIIPSELESLRSTYAPGRTHAAAFRDLLAHVFAGSGLLIYDPQHSLAKKAARPLMRRAFEEYPAIEDALISHTESLVRAGHKEQVSLRRGSPLFFVHAPDADGPRFRLQQRQDRYEAIGGNFSLSREEVSNLIEASPQRISSSALLRPLLQDSLFPTAAYVGGEAELRYLLQLEPAYRLLRISQPARIRRMSGVVIEPRTKRLLRELSLEAEAVLFHRNEVEQKMRGPSLAPDLLASESEARVSELIRYLSESTQVVGPQLEGVLSRSADKIRRAVSGVVGSYGSALQSRTDIDAERFRKLLQLLEPGGTPQERTVAAAYFLLKYGAAFTSVVSDGATRWSETLGAAPQIFSLGS